MQSKLFLLFSLLSLFHVGAMPQMQNNDETADIPSSAVAEPPVSGGTESRPISRERRPSLEIVPPSVDQAAIIQGVRQRLSREVSDAEMTPSEGSKKNLDDVWQDTQFHLRPS